MALLVLASHAYAAGSEITSAHIIKETLACTLNNQCARWKITGVCYWLECDPVCSVNQTFKVDHYSPDLVVSVFKHYQSNAWLEANTLIDPAAHAVGQETSFPLLGTKLGHGNQSASQPTEGDNHFKEVDVIGNPALPIFKQFNHFFIPSQATSFAPYYLSMADAYPWRSPLIEMVAHPIDSLTPGRRVVGSLVNNWGGVIPRTGFINQPSDPKSAAVIAQRAGDIVAAQHMSSFPHIGKTLSSASCGQACTVVDMKETDPNSALWQMVYPLSEKTGDAFGKNDVPGPQWQQAAFTKGNGNYVWVLWRHYQGCIPGRGTYLGSMGVS